ncbi:MAG: hypothetical protein ACYDGN_14525 [Acidimicrobiales bacterium]
MSVPGKFDESEPGKAADLQVQAAILLDAWAAAGLPLIRDDGSPGRVA